MMNPAPQAARLMLRLGRGRAIRAVRVHLHDVFAWLQKPIEFLAVMRTASLTS